MDDDRTLFMRLRGGDHAALRELVDRHHRSLFQFLYRLTDNHALADDISQQTFIRLLTYSGDAPDHLRGWLFTIARNLTYDHFRSAKFQREDSTDFSNGTAYTMHDSVPTPEQIAIGAEQRQHIASLLQQLPPEQREAVILRYYHDLSLQAIADVVDAPLGTVKSRLFHGLKKLKGYLIEIGQADE